MARSGPALSQMEQMIREVGAETCPLLSLTAVQSGEKSL
jgi:hypothetical protein